MPIRKTESRNRNAPVYRPFHLSRTGMNASSSNYHQLHHPLSSSLQPAAQTARVDYVNQQNSCPNGQQPLRSISLNGLLISFLNDYFEQYPIFRRYQIHHVLVVFSESVTVMMSARMQREDLYNKTALLHFVCKFLKVQILQFVVL